MMVCASCHAMQPYEVEDLVDMGQLPHPAPPEASTTRTRALEATASAAAEFMAAAESDLQSAALELMQEETVAVDAGVGGEGGEEGSNRGVREAGEQRAARQLLRGDGSEAVQSPGHTS